MRVTARIAAALGLALCLCTGPAAHAGEYVGSKACSECHEEQYANFSKYSKKAASWRGVEIMASDLTGEELRGCFECHATGYGRGGFVSFEQTPELAEVGCESCHGPGAGHAESGDPELIQRTPSVATCESCHSAERVEDFNFKPLLFSGAH